jgi:hypothetical protein
MGCSIPRSFNKTSLLFINSIFLLAVAAVLAAQDTSASVSGEIRGPRGATLGPLNAELTRLEPPHSTFSLRLDDEGRFKFTVLPPGTFTLTVAQLGFKTLKVKSIVVASADQKTLPPLRMDVSPTDMPWLPIPEFELRAGDQRFGNLAGRVMRDEVRPLTHATVQLFCGDQICGETKTDANGDFLFLNLAPRDEYSFRISHPGFYSWQGTDYTAFEVLAGYDATYEPIVLPRRHRLSRAASTVR